MSATSPGLIFGDTYSFDYSGQGYNRYDVAQGKREAQSYQDQMGLARGSLDQTRARFLQSLLSGGGMGVLNSLLGMVGSGSGPGMDEYAALTNRTLGELDNAGAGRRNDINQAFALQQDASMADLENRGFRSSNLAANASRANEFDRQRALTDLESGLAGQRANVVSSIGQAGLAAQQQNNLSVQQQQQSIMSSLLGGLF